MFKFAFLVVFCVAVVLPYTVTAQPSDDKRGTALVLDLLKVYKRALDVSARVYNIAGDDINSLLTQTFRILEPMIRPAAQVVKNYIQGLGLQ